MTPEEKTDAFQLARPQLAGVAFRLLGSRSEAEDVVQDTALKWFAHDGDLPDRPIAWLTTVCTNRCLDILRSSHRKRMDYVGPWIPEHLATETTTDAATNLEMASSLTTAFMVMLERLTPRERAAYLLHDIFDMDYPDVATSLNLSEANCRQLTARARRMIGKENVRFLPDETRQRELIDGFRKAIETGSAQHFASMLSDDVDLRADSGGKVIAVRHVLEGVDSVMGFIAGVLGHAWANTRTEVAPVNGQLGLTVYEGAEIFAAVTFGYDASGQVRNIFILRNPDKLAALARGPVTLIDKGGLSFN